MKTILSKEQIYRLVTENKYKIDPKTNEFGFEVIGKKAYQVLAEIVGGIKNLHFHTSKNHESDPIGGCGHL